MQGCPQYLAKNLVNASRGLKSAMPSLEGVLFGQIFAPHMLVADWTAKNGWFGPKIVDYGALSIEPQCSCLHYALQCFEGLKAYRGPKGNILMFRPDMNAKRMKSTMTRLDFPTIDPNEWVDTVKQLVLLDKDWVPAERGYSLYVRPTAIGTNVNLRVGPADAIKFFVILSPVGPYYATGFKPVKLMVDGVHKRAWPGGTGCWKMGCNYAGTIHHQVNYAKEGFGQVLWLGPNDIVEEVGAMNFMMLWKNKEGDRELITAPLTSGTILPGVTRDSVLTLAREWNECKVTERGFSVHEMIDALREKRVEELFGCGTACIITQVDNLKYNDESFSVPVKENNFSYRLMKEIQDIQYGVKDHPWGVHLN